MQDIMMPSRPASKSHHFSYCLLHAVFPVAVFTGAQGQHGAGTAQPVAVTPASLTALKCCCCFRPRHLRGDPVPSSPHRSSACIHTDSRLSNCGTLTEIKNKKLGESLKAAYQTKRGTNALHTWMRAMEHRFKFPLRMNASRPPRRPSLHLHLAQQPTRPRKGGSPPCT